jgi:polyphenol oxidase
MWLQSPVINCKHGFSTREGGVSSGSFSTLNLGGSDDDAQLVEKNRFRALDALQLTETTICLLKQVHGTIVKEAAAERQEGDALVSNRKDVTLAISVADCYPVLFHDPVNSVIGAAHAGWRGTCGGIVTNTIRSMTDLGADPHNIKVAIGQGICQEHFEVGPEVIQQFRTAGFPEHTRTEKTIDLNACIRWQLAALRVQEKNIWSMNRCTYEADFFSYRRDKGITGRMWGLISMRT